MNFLRLAPRKYLITGCCRKRFYSESPENDSQKARTKTISDFCANYFGISSEESEKIFKTFEYKILSTPNVGLKDVSQRIKLLEQMNFNSKDILKCPTALFLQEQKLKSRLKVLEESCFKNIRIQLLCGRFFPRSLCTSVSYLKKMNFIDKKADVPQSLIERFDVKVEPSRSISDEEKLVDMRMILLSLYLKAKLGMTDQDFARLSRLYDAQLRTKSFESIVNVIEVLQNELNFTNELIVTNAFLLSGSGESIKQLITDLPTIADVPIREIIIKKPALAIKSSDSIKTILDHIKSFDIPADRILKCLDVLLLGRKTVHERLLELQRIEAFRGKINQPRILHLVVHQTKAKIRLNYLKKLGIEDASIHVFSCSSEKFEKYKQRHFTSVIPEKNVELISKDDPIWKEDHEYDKVEEKDIAEESDIAEETDIAELAASAKYEPFLAFYEKLLSIGPDETRKLLKANPCLYIVDTDQIQSTADLLEEMGFTKKDFLDYPSMLILSPAKLKNRMKVIEECNLQKVDGLRITRLVSLMNTEIRTLKKLKELSKDDNIQERLINQLDIKVTLPKKTNDKMTLGSLRLSIITHYLIAKLGITKEDVKKLCNRDTWLKQRSLYAMVKVTDILKHELHFSKEEIMKTKYLLCACPENFSQLVKDVPIVGGVGLKKIIRRAPKIVLSKVESVVAILKLLKAFEIQEESILFRPQILCLRPKTVHDRLVKLMENEHLKFLCHQPNIVNLVYCYNHVQWRLNTLKQVDARLTSINILTQRQELFLKYVRNGVNTTKCRDATYYVAKEFKRDQDWVRSILIRHPNWPQTPILSIKATRDYLHDNDFTDEDIRRNLYILLYPMMRIEEKMNYILEKKNGSDDERMIAGVDLSKISNPQLLSLILYLIEKEFHFSGDGTWEPNHLAANQSLDVCLREVPVFDDRKKRLKVPKKSKAEAVN